MKTKFEKSFLAGLGLLSMTREKAEKIVNDLSKRGELEESQSQDWIDQLTKRGAEERRTLRKIVRAEVKNVLDDLGIVTKEDLQKLAAKEKPQNVEEQA